MIVLRCAAALFCGLLFGFGLAISGMLDPARVRGSLDVFGRWNPSLAFVLAGRRAAPLLAASYDQPTATRIDARLVAGAAVFGVGWGLSGLCPGPALADLALGAAPFAVFVAAMVAGVTLVRLADRVGTPPHPDGRGTDMVEQPAPIATL